MTELRPVIEVADPIRYLVNLADWAAGEGYCQIAGCTPDPDEWICDQWEKFNPDSNADGYSADALADKLIAARDRAVVDAIVAMLRDEVMHGGSSYHSFPDLIAQRFGGTP